MKKRFLNFYFLTTLCAGGFLFSCEDEKEKGNESVKTVSLDDFIQTLESPIQEEPQTEQIGDVFVEIDETTNTYCECKKYKANESFSEVLLLDPTSNIIYPGSILEGNSVAEGSYRQIVLDRAPLELSTNLQNFSGTNSRTVDNPTLSSIRAAIKDMIYDSEITGSTAAKMTFEIEEVHSEDQLNLAIGANVKSSGVNVSAGFNFSNKSIRSRFLVKFIQVYYTVDVDAPSSPSKFFAPEVKAQDLKNAIGGGSAVPVYVSSVQYGRVAYFCMESEERGDSVKANLEVAIKAGVADGALSTDFTSNSYTKNMKISGTIIGGSGEDAVQSVEGMDGLLAYIKKGGNYSQDSPGAPVAFTLTRLSNNEIFNVVNGTEFVARECKSTNAAVVPKYFYGIKGDNNVYGTITAQLGYSDGLVGSPIYLYNRTRDKYTTVVNGKNKDLSSDDPYSFKIDYSRIDNAYIQININLKDFDETCRCNKMNDDTYISVSKKYFLKDFSTLYRDEFDQDGNIVINDIKYEWDSDNRHYSCRLFGLDTCHESRDIPTDSRIRFAFKIQL